jgi:hypothetical protein
MTLDESIQGLRLQVMRRAAGIGVSAACREVRIFAHTVLPLAVPAEPLRRRWSAPAAGQGPPWPCTSAAGRGRAPIGQPMSAQQPLHSARGVTTHQARWSASPSRCSRED